MSESKDRAALRRIAALNPSEDSEEGFNEWGEADCFNQAQKVAIAALAQPDPAEQLAEAMRALCKQFPTDTDMIQAGWERGAINRACDAYDAAQRALAAYEGSK